MTMVSEMMLEDKGSTSTCSLLIFYDKSTQVCNQCKNIAYR